MEGWVARAAEDEGEEKFAQLRATPRDSMFVLATINRPGQAPVAIKVRNLSAGGMMAECPVNFVRDETVETDLRGVGTVRGRIAWTGSGRIGVAFETLIDPILVRKPVTGGPQPQLVKASKTMWRPGLR